MGLPNVKTVKAFVSYTPFLWETRSCSLRRKSKGATWNKHNAGFFEGIPLSLPPHCFVSLPSLMSITSCVLLWTKMQSQKVWHKCHSDPRSSSKREVKRKRKHFILFSCFSIV